MEYEKWLRERLIKKQDPDFRQIRNQLRRAEKDLLTAEAVLGIDRTWCFTIAYHATIRACRALMYSRGFLPTAKNSHKTVLEFTRALFGDEPGQLLLRLDRMRRKRHDFIYEAENHTSESEARTALATAQALIERILILVSREKRGTLL